MLLVRARVVNRMYIRDADAGTCTCCSDAQACHIFSWILSSFFRRHISRQMFAHSPSNDDASLQSRCSHVTPSFFPKDLKPGLAAKLGTAARLINLQRHHRCWARVNPCNTMSAPANNSPPLATPTVDYDLIHSMLKQRCPTLSANHDIHQSTANTGHFGQFLGGGFFGWQAQNTGGSYE